MINLKYNRYGNCQVVVMCNACKRIEPVTGENEDQTDRLLAHSWIKEHGWKTHLIGNNWVQFCPECESEYRNRKRTTYFSKAGEAND